MYNQYFDNTRSIGKVLCCLYHIGIPLHIVENVTIGPDKVYHNSQIFADIFWNGNIPVFDFTYEPYNRLLQKKYYKLVKRGDLKTPDLIHLEFNSAEELHKTIKQLPDFDDKYYIIDVFDNKVNTNLQKITENETTLSDKLRRLSLKFKTR